MKSNKRGRPTLHGIKIITSERIRKSRLAMANGSSKSRLAEDIFKVSPRTFRRLLSINHPMAIALKQAIIDGEQLQGEPLAHLLCMLRDQSPDQIDRINQALKDNEELKEYLNRDGRRRANKYES